MACFHSAVITGESLGRKTLDTLPFNIAVLDEEGTIVFTNRGWREFEAEETSEPEMIGTNYFSGIDETTDEYARQAHEGLQAVLEGRRELYKLEYPCHSPTEKRWFMMWAAQLPDHEDGSVVVAHIDITQRKLAELDARARERELEHLMARMDGLVQTVMESVLQADSRGELETIVCEQLVTVDLYVAAWVGRENLRTESIEHAAGSGGDAVGNSIPLDSADPTAQAARSGQVQVVEDLLSEDLADHYRVAFPSLDGREPVDEDTAVNATSSGKGSMAAFPLQYGDVEYGVLTVYANQFNAFNAREVAVLEVLARVCSTAINTIESRQIISADEVVELDVRLTNEGPFYHEIAAALDCRLTYHGSIRQKDETVTMLFLAADADVDALLAEAQVHDPVKDVLLISETDDGALLEFAVAEQPIVGKLAELGVETTDITAAGQEIQFTLELPATVEPRTVIEHLSETYPSTSLSGTRQIERQGKTKQELVTDIESSLTDRQRVALRKAYLGGFFDWPRETTGDELAESMDISRPTYHQHLRTAERKVISALFDD